MDETNGMQASAPTRQYHLIEFSQGLVSSALWKIRQLEDQLIEAERVRLQQAEKIQELTRKMVSRSRRYHTRLFLRKGGIVCLTPERG